MLEEINDQDNSQEEENDNIERIANGIISYLEFLKKFKKAKDDTIIKQDETKFSYIFRDFNLECYIIDKKYFDDFRDDTNFDELNSILNPINEENKKKFKEELKKYLKEHPYNMPNGEEIKIYSELEDVKKVVNNFNNYTFVNESLLCDCMGVLPDNLEGKKLKVSKNKINTCLISTSNDYILTINVEKKNQEGKKEQQQNEIAEYKNLYYVEEITIKIFILLYFNEIKIQNIIKNKIKDVYNFKEYYLINKKWLNEYKEFFLYDFIIKKIEEEINIDNNNNNAAIKDNNNNYSYNKAKFNLNNIVKKIGKIRLYAETKIDNKIRDANNLIPDLKKYTN